MSPILQKLSGKLRERSKLRRASGFHIATAHRLQQLNLHDWRRVCDGRSFYFSPEYLQMIESAGPENLEPRYALVSDDDGPLAAICMQIVKVGSDQFGASGVKKIRVPLKERVLVCGNLLSYGQHGVCFGPGVDAAEMWPAVAEALYRVRRGEKLSGQTDLIVVKDVLQADIQPSASLGQLSYSAVETEPNMVLELPPSIKTHEDYLASLTSSYRRAIKVNVFKAFDDAGFRMEHA